jgi:hypothetical protein
MISLGWSPDSVNNKCGPEHVPSFIIVFFSLLNDLDYWECTEIDGNST